MKAEIRLVDGVTLMAMSESQHAVVLDLDKASGGKGGAPSPMEYVLMSLGGCIGMTAIKLLQKRNVPMEDMSIELDAEREEQYPRAFTRITVKFTVLGEGVKEADVKWAVETARDRFCPVGAMLSKAAQIEYAWEVRPSR